MSGKFTIDAEAMTIADNPLTAAQDVAVREEAVPAVASQGEQVRSMILDLARDSTFDVEKLRALTEMQEHAEDRQALRERDRDLASAQGECKAVARRGEAKLVKDGVEKGSWYFAKEEDVDDMLRPIMSKYGFSLTTDRKPRQGDGGGFEITGTLRHRSGAPPITSSFPLPLDTGPGRNNLQAAGSTDSYGRKYIKLGFFDIPRKGMDDDGVAGGGQPITLDEAALIKKLVDEAGIGDGLDADERKSVIVEWFNDMLGYALPKGYVSIRQEDSVRVRRALLSLKARRLTSREREAQI